MKKLLKKCGALMQAARATINRWVKDEKGEVNIIAIIIIIAIAIALAVVFRKQIKELFDTIWSDITGNVGGATGNF